MTTTETRSGAGDGNKFGSDAGDSEVLHHCSSDAGDFVAQANPTCSTTPTSSPHQQTLRYVDEQQTLLEGDIEKIDIPTRGELNLYATDNNQEPCEGMLFESDEAARTFYDDYAGRIGFVTRVLSSRKSERDGTIISRGLGCRGDIENHKNEGSMIVKKNKGKENCAAMILVKRVKPGNWAVRKFIKEHNHPLRVSISKKRLSFDEKDKRIQELSAELRIKKRLTAAYREQLLAIMKDVDGHNEYLSAKVEIVHKNLKKLEANILQM